MKLFLTSAGLPPETSGEFLKLLGKKPEETKICFISTASYAEHPEGDAEYVKGDKIRLSELGFKTITEIDLRREDEKSLREKLKNFDVIFVTGGNTFYLLKYVRESGFDKAIKPFLDREGIYFGVSAGTIIAGKDISISGWKSDWDKNIVNLEDLRGMGLVDFIISPHYVAEHKAVINENKNKVSSTIYALTDSQAILVDDGKIQFIGPGEFKQFK